MATEARHRANEYNDAQGETCRPGRLPTLILGTAQLTNLYGILGSKRNADSELDLVARETLSAAAHCGFSALDTARAYGEAESVIGDFPWTGSIHTKLDQRMHPEESLGNSLDALKRSEVDLLYVHDAQEFLRSSLVRVKEIASLRGQGARKLGISVYEPAEAIAALQRLDFDVVQFPINPLDQRFKRAVENEELPPGPQMYFGRSVLLQGLLALDETESLDLPPATQSALLRWQQKCRTSEMSPGHAAVAWAGSLPFLDGLILGAESAAQVVQLEEWLSLKLHRDDEFWRANDAWPSSDPRGWAQRRDGA